MKDGKYMAVGYLEPKFYDVFVNLLQLEGPVPYRIGLARRIGQSEIIRGAGGKGPRGFHKGSCGAEGITWEECY
ncbi:hypothetical protein BGX38DRAFT_1164531, partial [Terfezia claveryi]